MHNAYTPAAEATSPIYCGAGFSAAENGVLPRSLFLHPGFSPAQVFHVILLCCDSIVASLLPHLPLYPLYVTLSSLSFSLARAHEKQPSRSLFLSFVLFWRGRGHTETYDGAHELHIRAGGSYPRRWNRRGVEGRGGAGVHANTPST